MEARIIMVALAVVLLVLKTARGSMFDRFNKKQGND